MKMSIHPLQIDRRVRIPSLGGSILLQMSSAYLVTPTLLRRRTAFRTLLNSERRAWGIGLNDQVQLCLQGLLLEEKTGVSIAYGYIFYICFKRRRKVPFDAELREATLRYVAEARTLSDSRKIPKPVHDKGCNECRVRPIGMPDEVSRFTRD